MKYFTDGTTVISFVDEFEAGLYIDLNQYRVMTDVEVDMYENHENYLSDEEKVLLSRKRMPNLTPIEFKWKLVNSGLYQQVEDFMSITDNLLLKIAYQNAIFFNRTDPILTQAMQALGLTDEQVDNIWMG